MQAILARVLYVVLGIVLGVAGTMYVRKGIVGEGAASWSYPPGCTVLVQRVVDGDTIVLSDGIHVRYRGIDTPETRRFVKDAAPLAEEAKVRNAQLVSGKRVRLVPASNPLDMYGRLLADVYVPNEETGDEVWVQEALVREGLARAATGPNPVSVPEEIRECEAVAKKDGAGIWGIKYDTSEASFREFPFCGGRGDDRAAVYHRRTCQHALRSQPMNLRFYRTQEEAACAGRRPCKQCLSAKGKGQE